MSSMTKRGSPALAVLERNRAALYRWFAHLFFAPPGEAEVIDLRSGTMQTLLQSLATTPGAGPGVAALQRVLESADAAQVAAAIGKAHTRLFDGLGSYEAAPLYRSVYSSDSGLLCQQATAEMEAVLVRHRLQLDERIREPADHLSIQLEVMAQLALRSAEAVEHGESGKALLAEQADFLDKQLLGWVPQIAERLAVIDKLWFHAGLATTLIAVLKQDRAYLADAGSQTPN